MPRELTVTSRRADNNHMSTTQLVPSELMNQLQEAVDRAAAGVRDPEAMRKACERMDRMREENLKHFGIQDIAVELIRDVRQ